MDDYFFKVLNVRLYSETFPQCVGICVCNYIKWMEDPSKHQLCATFYFINKRIHFAAQKSEPHILFIILLVYT